SSLLTRFLFLDHRYDLFVRKSCLHLSVLLLGGLYTNLEELKGRRSRATKWSVDRCAACKSVKKQRLHRTLTRNVNQEGV
ncbi:MAG: hypothetical protein ABJ360_16585, partial [Roseobacter sp.]